MGCCGSVLLPANLVFLIVERITCWDAVTQRTKTLKNFQLKMLHSVFLSISNPKKYISGTVIFASNRSKNSKIGCLMSKCKYLQNLVSTFPWKTSKLAVTNCFHDSLFLIQKTYMQTYSNSGAYINCCLKYINCCKINFSLN